MIRKILFLIGRILFSLIFLIAGLQKILNWSEMESGLAMKFCEWYTHLHGLHLFETLLAFVPALLMLATFFEIVGGLLFLSGFGKRIGALLLLLFLIPTTFLYHDFWFQVGDQRVIEQIMFMKNLALIGALLVFTVQPSKK